GGFDQLFIIGHYLVELLDDVCPLLVIEVGEGVVVLAAEFCLGLALQAFQGAAIPEQQMVCELSGGVISRRRLPAGLLAGEPVDGGVDGNKPICLVVRGVQLVKQEAAQGCRRLSLGVSRNGKDHGQKRDQDCESRLHGGAPFIRAVGKQTHCTRSEHRMRHGKGKGDFSRGLTRASGAGRRDTAGRRGRGRCTVEGGAAFSTTPGPAAGRDWFSGQTRSKRSARPRAPACHPWISEARFCTADEARRRALKWETAATRGQESRPTPMGLRIGRPKCGQRGGPVPPKCESDRGERERIA